MDHQLFEAISAGAEHPAAQPYCGQCAWDLTVILAPYISTVSTLRYEEHQCLSQDLETGCLKLAVVKILGVQILKGDHNILIFQP